MYQLVLALLLCWLALPVLAQQQLAKARQSSYLTKVFRLTETQARRLYERGLRAARPDFFTVPVDSFRTDSLVRHPLPLGYYLVAHTEGPELVYWLRADTDRTVEVLDNQVDLVLVVRDSLGQPLPTARVAVAGRAVPYDAATRTYRRAHAGRAGLVAVTHAGRTTFHPLEQSFPGAAYRQSGFGRLSKRVVFGAPLGYLTVPVWNLGRDLRHPSYTTTGLVGLARAAFSEEVREQRRQQRRQWRGARWRSYLVMSQPRYRPSGDTLRLKARVLRRGSGRPATLPLTLWLSGGGLGRDKRLATLRPVRPGSYEFALPLADTLGLRADTEPTLRLADKDDNTLATGSFQLEDYELNNARYALRALAKEPRRGQPQAVFLRGTDANDLPLLDARVRLAVVPGGEPGALAGRRLFVPDTLWTHTQALDALGETRVNLPARIFPNANIGYEVAATFLTADNERHAENLSLLYRRDPGRLHLTLGHDSVRLSYDSLGHYRPHRALLQLAARPARGNAAALLPRPVQLPTALPLNPQACGYTLTDAAGRAEYLSLPTQNADLSLASDRSPDSVRLTVSNPRRLPFWYFVYRGNALRYRGYATDYQLKIKDNSLVPWHVSLHYYWGERLRADEYTVAPPPPRLAVITDEPAVAYPGQRLRLGFTVTDEGGRPVPDADLTAYAYTSKFGAAALPALPSFARPVLGRQSRRRFGLADRFANATSSTGQQLLDWQHWRPQLGLDSLRFYDFLYPESGAFYEYRPAPGGLTQVAPFVVDSGRVQAPIAFYIDGQPAYLQALNQHEPYTAVATSGYHTLSLRTANRLVTLQAVYLRAGHKLTLSIDVNRPCRELQVAKRLPRLSPTEALALQRTIVAVAPADGGRDYNPAMLRQGLVLHPLAGNGYGYSARLAGPFRPDSITIKPLPGRARTFLFDPLYSYTFYPGVVKMTCLDPAQLGSVGQAAMERPLPLGDFAYSEVSESQRFQAPYWPVAVPREPVFAGHYRTLPGQGRLAVRLPPVSAATPPPPALPEALCTLLTRPDQPRFSRLGQGVELLPGLAPGRYRVAVLLADSTCLAPTETILVEANGQTYAQLRPADRQPYGPLSRRLLKMRRALVPVLAAECPARRETRAEQPLHPRPDWRTLHGRVTDAQSGEGLPGVTVLVQGTALGVATDASGAYSLQVPPAARMLVFSSVGYKSEEAAINNSFLLNTALTADTRQLNEVVVTGYGTQTRRDLTGSVASVNMLQGRVAGVAITNVASVSIRGNAALAAAAQPLYLVDGLPFNGRLSDLAPADIAGLRTLDAAAATALYGARASQGAVLITTKQGALLAGLPDLRAGGDPRLGLRQHFADHAWWRPTLTTDGQGRAHADVVLPDDATSWDTFVLGSDGRGRVGAATGQLRTFKALRAELAVPRFLVAGDQVRVLGKVLNYQPDTARVTTTFRVGERVVRQQARRVSAAFIDTLTVTAPAGAAADSVQLTFGLRQANGFADGERRRVPVLPAGTRERVGTFATLTAPDTTLALPLSPQLGDVTVCLESDALPVLLAEIQHLQEYAYLCNEQMASRLQGLLLEQRIRGQQGAVFKGHKAVSFLVRRLREGRDQPTGLWGTWPTSEVSPWATVHVVEALLAAARAGYPVDFNRDEVQRFLLSELAKSANHLPELRGYFRRDDDQIRLLHLLHALGAPADYATYVRRIERAAPRRLPLDRYLALSALRQELGLPYQLDSLRRYRLRTELGGVFYTDTLRTGSYFRYLLPDRVGTTLLAYQVLRTQGGHAAELARIRVFLLGLRGGGYWESTYQAAHILTTIGPDLLVPGGGAAAQVRFGGPAGVGLPTGPIMKFPFEARLAATGPLTLHKTGGLPVYATAYQTRWNPTPLAAAQPFVVTTTLAGQAGGRVALPAGQPTELVVTVEVKAEARYVLLEVPIPAGCSYGSPAAPNRLEVHREYLKQQAGIFIDWLPIGKHTFRVALQPRYRGSYTLNPARAELLYFPTKFGRAASKRVLVR